MAVLMKLTMLELHVTDVSTLGLLYLDDRPLCNFKLHEGSLDERENTIYLFKAREARMLNCQKDSLSYIEERLY